MAESHSLELRAGLRVVWSDLPGVRTTLGAAEPTAAWQLDGDLATGHSALRVMTGATRAGAVLLLAAARPTGAGGHDAEEPRAVLVSGSGEITTMDEALVSTQYDAAGRVERLGLELYAEGDDYPLRGAGDVRQRASAEQAILDFRLDGEAGTAILDIVHA